MSAVCSLCPEWTSDPAASEPWRCPAHTDTHGRAARNRRTGMRKRRKRARDRAAKT